MVHFLDCGGNFLKFRHRCHFWILIGFSLLAFCSCSSQEQSVLVWTDIPEIVIAAQIFNRESARDSIDVEFKAEAASELKLTSSPPSLVIAKYLLSKPLQRKFESLDALFSKFYIDPNDMYSALLAAGRSGAEQLLIPLSFDCMVLLEKKSEGASSGITIIDSEILRSNSKKFIVRENGNLTKMGFSPRWDMEFSESWILAGSSDFLPNPKWKPPFSPKPDDPNSWPLLWNKEQLQQSVQSLMDLSSDVRSDEENAFSFYYFNSPGYQLVLDERVLYWPMRASEFYRLPYSIKKQLQFRFPEVRQRILITPDTRYLGMPKGAKNKKAALEFARWLLVPENQEKIWKEMESQRLIPEHVGPFGGFSTLIQINNVVFPKYFPEYAQNPIIPSTVPTPKPLADYWDAFSKDFLRLWIDRALSEPLKKETIDENFQESLQQYLGGMPNWLNPSH